MALRDDLLPLMDLSSQLQQDFGLPRYAVTVRVRTWAGAFGDGGAHTDADLPILPSCDVQLMKPFSAQMSAIMMAGGTIEDRYFKISGLTPRYTDPTTGTPGGYTPQELAPKTDNEKTEVVYLLTGDDGIALECTLVAKEFDDPFEYVLTVREKRRRTDQNTP
jgi:hypothetical protein